MNWNKIFKIFITLGIGILLFATFYDTYIEKPSMVSIDSIVKMSCDELHTNFQYCRLENKPENWLYCVNYYVPIYYQKCPEGDKTDRVDIINIGDKT